MRGVRVKRPNIVHNLRHLNRVTTGLSCLLHGDHVWAQPTFFTLETINTRNFRCVDCPLRPCAAGH